MKNPRKQRSCPTQRRSRKRCCCASGTKWRRTPSSAATTATWGASIPALDKSDSRLIKIGTPFHPLSLIYEMMKKPPENWVVRSHKALQDDGTSLWPAKWSVADLKRIQRQIGIRKFL